MNGTLLEEGTEAQKVISQLSAMAMMDEEFKSRLLAHPATVLTEHGLEIPEDIHIEIVGTFEEVPAARDPHTLYLVIPNGNDLMQEDLSMTIFAAQSCQSTASTACTTPSCISSSSTASTNSCN
ncbi:MAG TPA: hypothetical protein VJ464_14615 [Blastocatellia bacterium]|nr:hypothetical protein [Blastocatellia bacterium]